MNLSREDILKDRSLKRDTVNVQEWGGDVTIRELTADEATALHEAITEKGNANARWVVACAIDQGTGAPLFTEEDVAKLSSIGGAAVIRVSTAAINLSGYGQDPAKN